MRVVVIVPHILLLLLLLLQLLFQHVLSFFKERSPLNLGSLSIGAMIMFHVLGQHRLSNKAL
jgi:hypothetical protein